MMANENRGADRDPALAISRFAEALLGDMLERGAKKDRHMKELVLHLLLGCDEKHCAIPPPDKLILLTAHLLGLGHARKTRENPYSNDLSTDQWLRHYGYYLGFAKPQPETVMKIDGSLIPLEMTYAPDPTGNRPSVATDEEVAKHMGERLDQVEK